MNTSVLGRLLADLWPLRWRVLLASFLVFLCVGSSVGLMYTSGTLIALAASHPPIAALSLGVVGVRFFGLARGALRYVERLVSHATGFRVLARWRLRFFAQLEPLVPYGLGEHSSGQLLSRLGHDVDKLEALYTRVISPLLSATWIAIFMMVLLGSQGLLYMVWFLMCYGAAALVPQWFRKKMATSAERFSECRGRMASYAQAMMLGHAEMRVLGLEDHFQENLQLLGRDRDLAWNELQKTTHHAESWAGLFPGLAVLGVLCLGALDWSAGHLDAVHWVGILLGVMAAFEAVQGFSILAGQLEESQASGARLLAVTQMTPPVQEPFPITVPPKKSGTPALKAQGLSFAFPGGPELFHLNFTLNPGGLWILKGPSGSGKSTLASILVRFLEYQGSVELFGRELRTLPGDQVRREICLLDQEVHLFTGTLADNLRWIQPDAEDSEIIRVLYSVGLGQWFEELPTGLETWLGERGLALSGGERQRIAAARALLCKAPIVVADEPAAHLHTDGEAQLLEAFRQAEHRPAVVWISHRLN